MEERLGDLAMWWGNQYYCDTVVGNPSACPDGLQLLACLVYPVRNTAVTVEAARTVANLAYYASSERERALFVRSGIVPELVKAMQWGVGYGQGDEEVVKFCCMALADLCLDSKDVRLAAVEAGAPAILSVVLQRMDDTDVVKEAERACAVLVCEAKGRTALAKHGNGQLLLRTSIRLDGGKVMMRRSLKVFDHRMENRQNTPNSATDICEKTSPNKNPSKTKSWQQVKNRGQLYLGAASEVKRLRWHRGKYDDVNRPVVDATERMTCKVDLPCAFPSLLPVHPSPKYPLFGC